jgi:hypothetical protein
MTPLQPAEHNSIGKFMNLQKLLPFIVVFYAVGQLLHWYQLSLIAKQAGAQIQIPKMRNGR